MSVCNVQVFGRRLAERAECLARAFFYSGAHSHWEVYSGPAVKRITGAVERLKGE
jgi:hypothetical protein